MAAHKGEGNGGLMPGAQGMGTGRRNRQTNKKLKAMKIHRLGNDYRCQDRERKVINDRNTIAGAEAARMLEPEGQGNTEGEAENLPEGVEKTVACDAENRIEEGKAEGGRKARKRKKRAGGGDGLQV